MPEFLVKADFATIISTPALDNLTDGDDTIIDIMITEAVMEMVAYIVTRYDITTLFAGDGFFHPTLQMYCKDIVLYHLHSRHHQRPMPEIRSKRYQLAMQWLKDIKEQKIDPFAIFENDAEKSIIKAGGNPKRENHQL